MSNELARRIADSAGLMNAATPARRLHARQSAKALARIESVTVARIAAVQGHAAVQHEKMIEVDRLTRTAMTGQAMLSRWSVTLAAGDAFMADDLKFFADVAKIGKGEIIADTIGSFSREGRS